MVAQRGIPPQWGRSFRAVSPLGSVADQQLVRVDLAVPTDMALYLSGWVNDRSTAGQPGKYRVTWGSGGTSQTDLVITPMVGQVLHLVAATVQVDAAFKESGIAAQCTVRASLGLGRPSPAQFTHIGISSTVSRLDVAAATPREIRVPPFVARMRLEVFDLVGVAADATVTEEQITGGGIFTRPVSAYADFQNLDAGTWVVRLDAVIGTTYSVLVVFERVT